MKEAIRNKLKQLIRNKRLTLDEVAELCKTHKMNIYRMLEKEECNPTYNTICTVTKNLGMTLSELFSDDIDNENKKVNGFIEYNSELYRINTFSDLVRVYEIISEKIFKYNVEKKDNSGYCYIMSDDNYPNLYKIGKSKNPTKREETLLHSAPSIRLYKVVKTDNMHKLEKDLHKLFSNKRVRGEWFELSDSEINNLIECYNFTDF